MKKKLFSLLLILFMFICCDSVQAMDDYGIYCEYGYYETYIYILLTIDSKDSNVEFDNGSQDDLEHGFEAVLGVSLETGRPSNAISISDQATIDWLKERGFIDFADNFQCPDNPFQKELADRNIGSIGLAYHEECNDLGCSIYLVPDAWKPYTCNYVSKTSMNALNISFSVDENLGKSRWDITYPDGYKNTLYGTEINGNFMPNSDCSDIYYTPKDRRIKIGIAANENISNNLTLGDLCDSYKQNEIEHFCSGNCDYNEMNCPVGSYGDISDEICPPELKPIIWFIKKLVFNTVQIFVPIILIIMGTIDLVKAMISSDDKSNKEAISKFIRRVLSAVLVYFVVTIVSVVIGMFAKADLGDKSSWEVCWYNLD